MIQAVKIVRQHIADFAWRFYEFTSRRDAKVCPECNKYDYSVMTRKEIEVTFKYLVKVSDKLWLPNVHPNCRCELRFEEEEEDEDVKREYWGKKER